MKLNQDLKWKKYRDTNYEVCEDGQVRAIRYYKMNNETKLQHLTETVHKESGVVSVRISLNNKQKLATVHSLVAECFIGPRPEGLQIDHIDGNRANNHKDNLEYVTPKENIQRAWANGQCKPSRKPEFHPKVELAIAKLANDRRYKIKELCEIFDITDMTIIRIRKRAGLHYDHRKHNKRVVYAD